MTPLSNKKTVFWLQKIKSNLQSTPSGFQPAFLSSTKQTNFIFLLSSATGLTTRNRLSY